MSEGLLGALLGGVLATLGFLFKMHLDQKAKLNEALYGLLELYRLIVIAQGIDVRAAIEVYFSELEKYFPGTNRAALRATFGPLLQQSGLASLAATSDALGKGLEEQIGATSTAIAPISPLLAARINGNRHYRSIFPVLEEYSRSVRALLTVHSVDAKGLEIVESESRKVHQHITKRVVKDLQKDILYVAWHCSVVTWARCSLKIWRHNRTSIQSEYEKLLRTMIGELVAETKGTTIDHTKT